MSWLKRLFTRKPRLQVGTEFRKAFVLYSEDGKRAVEIREFRHGETYLLESEWTAGDVFKERHAGAMVGPFKSPAHAEKFIVTTPWFQGDQR